MITPNRIIGLDNGGQGWNTTAMANPTNSIGEPPKTGNVNLPHPACDGEPILSENDSRCLTRAYRERKEK